MKFRTGGKGSGNNGAWDSKWERLKRCNAEKLKEGRNVGARRGKESCMEAAHGRNWSKCGVKIAH